MRSWTKTIRMLRQLAHRLDERTLLSDQLLGSRMLRDSFLPRHWQARVYWRTDRKLFPDKIEYHLSDLVSTYHDLEDEMMARDSRPVRAFPKPPPPRPPGSLCRLAGSVHCIAASHVPFLRGPPCSNFARAPM